MLLQILTTKEIKKIVSVSSLKCNNINVNVNGLELNVFHPFLGGEVGAASAEDGETDTKSFAVNGDGSQINDFRFICINNNNNNTVIGAGNDLIPVPPTPSVDECSEDVEACFEEFLCPTDFGTLTTTLENGGLTVQT